MAKRIETCFNQFSLRAYFMPRKFLKRFVPHPEAIRKHKGLRWLTRFLEDPYLFHLNRRSVSGAFAAGLFWAFMPIPLQMLAAAITAILVRINLPLSVALVWLTNPVTMPPAFYFNYLVGTWILGHPTDVGEFHMNLDWIGAQLHAIWLPLYLGSFIVSTLAGTIGYLGMRGFWRWHVIDNYRKRRDRRRSTAEQSHP